MFRPEQPCYPQASRRDGCFPDNARTSSPFSCWISGALDRLSAEDTAARAPTAGQRPARPGRNRPRPDRDR